MARKLNPHFSREEKDAAMKFKSFYSRYMKRTTKNHALRHYKDHRSYYKKAFILVEMHKDRYFAFNYLVSALKCLNNYLESDIALPFEEEMHRVSEKWNRYMQEVEDMIVLDPYTREILHVLIREYNCRFYRDENTCEVSTEFSEGDRAVLKKSTFYEKPLGTGDNISLVVESYTLCDRELCLCYPRSDYDFINSLKYIIFHINLFARDLSATPVMEKLREFTVDIQTIIDRLFYKEILKSRADAHEVNILSESIFPQERGMAG